MNANPVGAINKCPNCGGIATIFATEHCPNTNPRCTWKRCKCGHTYNPETGRHIRTITGLKDAT